MSTETCATCRFFLADSGVCRRYPPGVTVVEIPNPPNKRVHNIETGAEVFQTRVLTEFPRMQPHGWCGEWSGTVQ